jgi:hypothetical protein
MMGIKGMVSLKVGEDGMPSNMNMVETIARMPTIPRAELSLVGVSQSICD